MNQYSSIHPPRLARSTEVVNERPGIGSGNGTHAWQCLHQDGGGILDRDVSAGEHKRADFGRMKRKPLELAITDAFVAGEDYPAALSGSGKPDLVGSASREVFGKALDQGTGVAQRCNDRRTVERLVEKKSERLRRP
jgi:hypothetical protein